MCPSGCAMVNVSSKYVNRFSWLVVRAGYELQLFHCTNWTAVNAYNASLRNCVCNCVWCLWTVANLDILMQTGSVYDPMLRIALADICRVSRTLSFRLIMRFVVTSSYNYNAWTNVMHQAEFVWYVISPVAVNCAVLAIALIRTEWIFADLFS